MKHPAIDDLVDKIAQLTPGTRNAEFYKEAFDAMSPEEFEDYISALESGKEHLFITDPSFKSNGLDLALAFKLANDWNVTFHEPLIIDDPATGMEYQTPHPHLCLKIPVRRMSQLLSGKISTSKGTKTDALTGQVVGASKASAISLTQMTALAGAGLNDSLVELMQFRGGDRGAAEAMDAMLLQQGWVSSNAIMNFSTGAESTKSIHKFMIAMHLSSNLYMDT